MRAYFDCILLPYSPPSRPHNKRKVIWHMYISILQSFIHSCYAINNSQHLEVQRKCKHRNKKAEKTAIAHYAACLWIVCCKTMSFAQHNEGSMNNRFIYYVLCSMLLCFTTICAVSIGLLFCCDHNETFRAYTIIHHNLLFQQIATK